MKINANAGVLARALALAASLDPGKRPSAALEAVGITSGDGAVTLTGNVLNHQISLTISATIERAGALAVPSAPLAALTHGFPATADIVIEVDGSAAQIRSGHGRYKLSAVPAADMPAALALAVNAGCTELSRAEALALFSAGFAAASDARIYLGGLFVAGGPDGLTASSTDGYAFARRVLKDATGCWKGDVIVPTAAVKIVTKLLGDKNVERITLRRSATLFAIETPAATFVTTVIDGTFPDYKRIIPEPSANTATVGRDALLRALARVRAVGARTARLSWARGEPALHLRANGDTEDLIDAETGGNGKVALAVDRLAALLEEFSGNAVTLSVADAATPVRLCDGDDPGFLAVLAPITVPGGAS